MRLILGTIVGFYVLNFWFFPIINQVIFPWGGVPETHLHPIYSGMILIAGLIVACTKILLDEINGLKRKKEEGNQEK